MQTDFNSRPKEIADDWSFGRFTDQIVINQLQSITFDCLSVLVEKFKQLKDPVTAEYNDEMLHELCAAICYSLTAIGCGRKLQSGIEL